ncbi:MAG: tripartite tricarboxylate transporter substrate binding protein [Reyranella sp.]|uniref:Bug family tripartite tricarboxylate transporter substrate binding protein n=1 Tax=Reyranella sp. TaxID=1929291 RepID=UPI0012057EB3|nr:tripartite tricarboxylate transporter substrate binding protein [Reyranella sp.]TAJ94889.1 MAG: tripartite tricarboxylate transporter substrate binding protein [Reyranella sp.]TBR21797.1 MAG: tripartite tricarboxylate transporter substrate binding protein [Reyranella sp.]
MDNRRKNPAKVGRRLFLGGAAAGLVAAPAIVSAQNDWPNKQIRIVIPYPPGGPSDVTTRIVLERAGALLGQSILFDNKAGASGAIGAEHVIKSAPADGYTFLTTTTAMVCITEHLQPLPYDTSKDLVAVARTATSWVGMGINPQLPANNLQEFIAYAKANPGKVNFGSAGLATITQLYGEIFNIEAGVKMVHVPYKGSAPATNDLLSGQIQVQFDPTTLPHIAAGRLKCFAVLGEKRWPGKPDVPTLKEQGLGKIGGDAWYGILAARGTPQAAIDRMSAAIGEAVKDPGLNEKLVASGNYSSFQDTKTFQATIERERVSFGEIVRKADIKV